jgi:hypothetical protein
MKEETDYGVFFYIQRYFVSELLLLCGIIEDTNERILAVSIQVLQ